MYPFMYAFLCMRICIYEGFIYSASMHASNYLYMIWPAFACVWRPMCQWLLPAILSRLVMLSSIFAVFQFCKIVWCSKVNEGNFTCSSRHSFPLRTSIRRGSGSAVQSLCFPVPCQGVQGEEMRLQEVRLHIYVSCLSGCLSRGVYDFFIW